MPPHRHRGELFQQPEIMAALKATMINLQDVVSFPGR
jgi:hypothetical protein